MSGKRLRESTSLGATVKGSLPRVLAAGQPVLHRGAANGGRNARMAGLPIGSDWHAHCLPSRRRCKSLTRSLRVWTFALATAGAVLLPIAAHAQLPFPPPGYPIFVPEYQVGSAARLLVTPQEAEVYVDGRYAGKVRDFHGFTQRLDLPAGGHELALYLEGYRTMREKLYFQAGDSYKIKGAMERLGAGESSGPRPEPVKRSRRPAREVLNDGAPPALDRRADRSGSEEAR